VNTPCAGHRGGQTGQGVVGDHRQGQSQVVGKRYPVRAFAAIDRAVHGLLAFQGLILEEPAGLNIAVAI